MYHIFTGFLFYQCKYYRVIHMIIFIISVCLRVCVYIYIYMYIDMSERERMRRGRFVSHLSCVTYPSSPYFYLSLHHVLMGKRCYNSVLHSALCRKDCCSSAFICPRLSDLCVDFQVLKFLNKHLVYK